MDPCKPDTVDYLHMADSQAYIASLEKKLDKLKKPPNNPSSARDMLKSLSEAKGRELDNITYVSSYNQMEEEDTVDHSSLTLILQRKLQPDKQAINTEEMQQLLKNDQLAKLVSEEMEEDSDSSPCTSSVANSVTGHKQGVNG